jgi:4,5-dihydroxyphthalate decarboxylase
MEDPAMTTMDALLERAKEQASLFPVSLALADYDRTRPLIDGTVKPKGIAIQTTPGWIGDFCLRPVYEEYDAAEMSLSWYVMARLRGEPVVALPVFPLRMPVLAYIFVRKDSPYTQPKDLVGKRVGAMLYRITVNLWLRGILQDHYGVAPTDLNWVITSAEEGAGFKPPPGLKITTRTGVTEEELLERGEVDAIFVPEVPAGFAEGRSNFRRLFPDPQAEMQALVRRLGQVPITHTIVMKQSLAERQPWVARSLTQAFLDAQDACDAYASNPKHLSMPDAVFFLEQQRAIYGPKPYVHGVEANRTVLETFVRYAHAQGYIPRVPALDELFPEFGQ